MRVRVRVRGQGWVQLMAITLLISSPLSSPAEPVARSFTRVVTLGGLLELGGLRAPQRGPLEAERLPWRARESHALYPARAELSAGYQRSRWRAVARARLYAAPLWERSPLAERYTDPNGAGPALSELWLSYTPLSNELLTLTVGGGRWVPHEALTLRAERLEASERLWSSAPQPRDRSVSGAFLELRPQAGRSGWGALTPARVRLSTFTPSADRWLSVEEPKAYLLIIASWRAPHSALSLEGGSAEGEGLSWGRLELELMSAALQAQASRPALERGWRYTGGLLYRDGPQAPSPSLEAQDASVGLYGEGLSVSHRVTHQEGRLKTSVGYEWRDPQLDFDYNAQHILSIQCGFAIVGGLNISVEHQHLWSARDDRLSTGSDLTFARLSWAPEWSL